MSIARNPRFIQTHVADSAGERAQACAELLGEPATVSPKYFYDALGSRLFEAITELPEYYPTRTEAGIFDSHAAAMARHIGPNATLIDLGAGNCAKAARLFPLLEPRRYVAVDISVDFLREALRQLQRDHAQLDIVGLGMDFSAALALPAELASDRCVFLYAGSSIGNFTPAQALAFLRRVREQAHGGGLLVGVDLVKPASILVPAYDDALGVTAAFNLNLLRHLNRLIESDFRPEQWRHVGLYNAAASRIEMHLEARADLSVRWPGGERPFARGQRIHTENSYKYTIENFGAMLVQAGFASVRHWSDPLGWFAVFWASAEHS